MSFWRKSLFYSALMILQAGSARICGVFANGLLARMLTPTEWGSVQAINTMTGTMAQTLKLGVDWALQVRIAETPDGREAELPRAQMLGSGVLLVSAVSAVALVGGTVFSEQAARLFGDASLGTWMGVAGVLAALQLGNQLSSVSIALGRFRAYAAINTYAAIGNVVSIAALYALGMRGLWVAITATIIISSLTTFGGIWLAVKSWREHGLSLRFERIGKASLELLRLGLPLHLAGAVPAALWLFLNVKLARVSGVESLAALRVVMMVNQLVAFAPGALAQTFVTQLASARGSGDRVPSGHYLRYLRVIVASSLITALGAAVIKPYLVRIAFGSQYVWTTSLLDLGLISIILGTVKQALLVGLISERRTGYALVDSLVSTITSAAIGNVLIPQLQAAGLLLGELLGNLASFTILFGLLSVRVRGEGKLLELVGTAGSLFAGLLMLAASYALRDSGSHVLPLAAGLALLLLCLPFVLFTRDERSKSVVELQRLYVRLRS